MKKTFTLISFIFITNFIFSQNLQIDVEESTAQIKSYNYKFENIVVNFSDLGNIENIYLFDTENEAEIYSKNPKLYLAPNKMLTVKNTRIYYSGFKIVDYYSDYDLNLPGEISKIGEYKIEYSKNYNDNSTLKIKKIGNLEILYYPDYDMNSSNKIKSFSDLNFFYYSNLDFVAPGRISKINEIQIKYNSNIDLYNPYKLSKIGNISFEYFTPLDNKTNGNIKAIKGTDDRFGLF